MSNHRKNIGEKKRAAMGDEHYGQASVKDLRRLQMNFEAGDMYEPKTFSLKKFKASRKITGDMFADITGGGVDVVDYLGLKHIDREYKNVAFLAEFTSQMGRIKHRDETGLRAVNQRKVAKAVRRAIGIGLLPSVHRHPELLRKNESKYGERF